MFKILSGKSGLLDECIGRGIERRECATQGRRHVSRHAFVEGLQARAEHARVDLGEEKRDAPAERGDGVAELPWDAAQSRRLRAWLFWSSAITLGLVALLYALARGLG